MNQANALSHLGIFKPALEKLAEAYKLFQCYDQAEQAAAARELIEQIHTEAIPAMDNYQRQHVCFFLQTAVERFVERLEQRCRGSDAALDALRNQPDSDLVWLDGYVDAVLSEFLLDNTTEPASFYARSPASLFPSMNLYRTS